MKKELNFEALATQYGLSIEFVKELHDKVVDKENFEPALRMFKGGTLKYEIAFLTLKLHLHHESVSQ